MKAIVFSQTGGPDVLTPQTRPIPSPGPGEVLIRVEAAGVNYADTIRRRGDFYPMPTPLPYVLGGEAAGFVVAVGEGVTNDWVGRRVIAACPGGGYAEYALSPTALTYPFPDGLEPGQALALLIQGLTAYFLLRKAAQFEPGASVFIEGAAGGVGSLAVQIARLLGAGMIIGGASAAKHGAVRALGVDHVVDYHRPGWTDEARQITGGRGVDRALDMVGGSVFEQCLELLALGGRLVVYGSISGSFPPVKVERLMARSSGVATFFLGAYLSDRAQVEAALDQMAAWVRTGQLKITTGGEFPLEDAARAHAALEGGASMGKLILTIG